MYVVKVYVRYRSAHVLKTVGVSDELVVWPHEHANLFVTRDQTANITIGQGRLRFKDCNGAPIGAFDLIEGEAAMREALITHAWPTPTAGPSPAATPS